MKSFEIENNPVLTSLKGLALTNPAITLIPEEKVLVRKTNASKVALISGGGAGHEPAHAGYIGRGMLSAAVSGDIFASPSTKQILNGIKACDTKKVLLIVKNYTGDVLHFGLAAERAKALGYESSVVVIGDDVAVGKSKGGLVGRRAIAGTVLVHKIVGAFAESHSEKYGVAGCHEVAEIVNNNLVSIGASLDHCKVPGRKFESDLGDNEMELGMGIHNEPGVQVLGPIPSTEELLEKKILPKLLDQADKDRTFVPFDKDDEVVLLVNNLGGVSNLIMTAIAEVTTQLLGSQYKIKPVRTIVGTLMTAFNGNGFSITLFNAGRANRELQTKFKGLNILELLDAPTDAPAWPVPVHQDSAPEIDPSIFDESHNVQPAGQYNFDQFSRCIKTGSERLIKAEPYITKLDTQVGDGDCGYTLVAGAEGMLKNLESIPKNSLSEALAVISDYIETFMGGTSGGLYSILISGLSHGVIEICDADTQVDKKVFAEALQKARDTLFRYTNARVGDSTMIDALDPFVNKFAESLDLDAAVKAAEEGAESTGHVEAKFGRASYVGDSSNVADPGAIGFVEFLKGVQEAL